MKQQRSFAVSEQSVGEARRFAAEATADLPIELADAVVLMVSELATNALVHASSGFDMTIDRTEDEVRVEVADRGDGIPSLRDPDSRDPHGRGLRIVEELADAWGATDGSGSGKAVWFRTVIPQDAGPRRRRSTADQSGSQRDESSRGSRRGRSGKSSRRRGRSGELRWSSPGTAA